jgi:ankyrin repeat protein
MFIKHARAPIILVLAFVFSISAQPPQSDSFYQAIRNDNLPVLRELVKAQGANVKDAAEQTPLMFAAAFGSRDAVSVLVESGADVNATSKAGLTALHLAWRDEAVVRLLLDHGANVNARSLLGFTPLIVAASATGTAGVVALLLDKGADVNAAENRRVTPLIAAAGVGNTAAAKLLLERGANANAAANGPGQSQKTVTPLMGAAHNGDVELTRLLLARKVDVNVKSPDNDGIAPKSNLPVTFGSFTALHLATAASSSPVVKMLLDAGALIDEPDVNGATPLIWAVATDRPNLQIVQLLLNKGANVTAASKAIEGALGWARKFNNPAVLSELNLTPAKVVAAATASRTIAQPREAVERSLAPLRAGSEGVSNMRGCPACHAQPMTSIVAELATRRGWKSYPALEESSLVTSKLSTEATSFLQGREFGGLPDNHLYGTFMMAALNMPPSSATDAWVYYLAAKQRQAGNWHGMATRTPIQDGDISRTALAIEALSIYGIPARKAEFSARINRAAAWLSTQQPQSTEERIMQLLGLSWAAANWPLRETRILELKALQHSDGGWGQTPNLVSDAYATGQVLYTLHELGQPASDPGIQRGIAFLLRTQAEDGTWHVISRAMKIQPYFESGFPYEHDQWISQSGTAWAAMALAVTDVPPPAARGALR